MLQIKPLDVSSIFIVHIYLIRSFLLFCFLCLFPCFISAFLPLNSLCCLDFSCFSCLSLWPLDPQKFHPLLYIQLNSLHLPFSFYEIAVQVEGDKISLKTSDDLPVRFQMSTGTDIRCWVIQWHACFIFWIRSIVRVSFVSYLIMSLLLLCKVESTIFSAQLLSRLTEYFGRCNLPIYHQSALDSVGIYHTCGNHSWC